MMNAQNRNTRARLLAGVGTAVLGALIASGGHAAETTIDQSGTPNAAATAGLSINAPVTNSGAVTASVDNADGKLDQTGVQTGSSNTVSANTIAASATGNSNDAAIPALPSIGPDGAAILNTSVNQAAAPPATGVVSSTVSDSRLSVGLDDFQSGSATNNGNMISADATLNAATSSISGSVPGTFASATPGSSTLDYPDGAADQFSAQGSVVVSSAQQAVGTGQAAGSNASVTGNDITLELTSTGDNTVSSGPVVDDNAISATFKGNTARNTVDIQAGLNPQFAGSAVVSNLQVNAADGASDVDDIAAHNAGSTIGATVIGGAGVVNTLAGSLSVAGNSITSAATGNEAVGDAGAAGNLIRLGDGMSVAGAGTPDAGADIAYDGGGVVSTVQADLVIVNSQGNTGTAGDQSLNSVTENAAVTAAVQALAGGSVGVSANRIGSSAGGNTASSAVVTGENTAAFDASVALANQQTNDQASVGAVTRNSTISASVGAAGVAGSADTDSVSVANNTSAANAYGNQAGQNVTLEANSIALGTGQARLTGGTGPDGHVGAEGAATVSSLQSRYAGAVSASNETSQISLTSLADANAGTSLAASNNRQEAVALGSSSANGLSLAAGADAGSGAGVANVQIASDTSPVTATLSDASADVTLAGDLGAATGGSAALTDNLQRAIGYGNTTANTLALAGNSASVALADTTDLASTVRFNPAGAGGLVFDNDAATAPTVVAAYGLLNDQSAQADVRASADGQFGVTVGADVQTSSSVANNRNALVGAAYGNDAANGASVSPGQIDTGAAGGFAAVANVTNVQAVGGDADVLAGVTGGNVVATTVGGIVDDSSVATSDNLIQALAFGDRAAGNTLDVNGVNIATAPALGDPTRGGATQAQDALGVQLVTNASFSVQSAQSGQGSVTATQREGATTAAQVRVTVGDDVLNSSVTADRNVSTASATSNSAANSLGVSATELQTTTAVQNFQTTSADVEADIGLAGVPGSPGFTTTIGGTATGAMSLSGDTLNVTGTATLTFGRALTADEAAYLNGLSGVTATAGSSTITLSGSIDTMVFQGFNFDSGADGSNSGDETIILTGFSNPGTAGVPGAGGVTIALGGAITGSQLSVDGNTTAGSVTGNNAINALTVAATNIAAGSGLTTSAAGLLDTDTLGATGDHVLANSQTADGATLTSDVFGTFALDAAPDAAIGDSTLSVSGNKQSASAVANTAANTLKVGDPDTASISAGSALASFQSGNAAVDASSDVELFTPAAVSGSSVNLTGNSNTALGVLNDVSNALTVQAANVAPVDAAANVTLSVDGANVAIGDHVLSNNQSAVTSASSTAATRLYNEDRVAAATSGLVDSSLTLGDNTTMAEASANRALNTLSISGGATQGANAGVANSQSSSAVVQADATTSATLTLAADPVSPSAALNGSSAAISGNSTTALARGNTATNALNASAGSSYGAPVAGAGSAFGVANSVAATAGVLNSQANSGDVTASSLNAAYTVALNATLGDPAVSNGAVGVTGNQVAAQAFGNSATNLVTLAALNTGAPTAAVGNYQVNTGAIRATATAVTVGATGVGTVAGSSFGVTGNQVSATAVGNSAVSTITAGR